MKKIILLTKQYPYGNREQFIDAELRYCSENNIEIDIVSTFTDVAGMSLRSLPDHIILKSALNANKLNVNMMKCLFEVFRSNAYTDEIAWLKKNKIMTRYKAIRVTKFLLKSLYIAFFLENLYSVELSKDPTNIVFYSYWMEEAACAAAILKNKYGCLAVSRVHGYDLYTERHRENYLPLQQWMQKNLSIICPVSETGQKYLENRYSTKVNAKTRKLATEDYGVSPDNKGKFTIVSCSNVIPLKRVELIAEAMCQIESTDIRWVHFGDGASMDNVQSIVSHCRFVECILMGRKLHEEVFEFYKNNPVDLFINVSTTEGLPVSIMEAISFGIPVLATDVGGTHEIVKDNENGRLLDVDITAGELAEKVIEQVNLDKSAKDLQRKKARQIWESQYEYRIAYANFYKLFV